MLRTFIFFFQKKEETVVFSKCLPKGPMSSFLFRDKKKNFATEILNIRQYPYSDPIRGTTRSLRPSHHRSPSRDLHDRMTQVRSPLKFRGLFVDPY